MENALFLLLWTVVVTGSFLLVWALMKAAAYGDQWLDENFDIGEHSLLEETRFKERKPK